jgi:vacuolar-type H+-ATPase subunit H
MIQELVNRIHQAEEEAEAMVARALEEAKAMNFDADAEAARILADAKAKIKTEKKKVTENAEMEAQIRFDDILSIGEREAEKLMRSVDIAAEAEAIADFYCEQYRK